MEIKYDKKADAKYIRIKKGKVAYTSQEKDWLLFDRSKNGDVLGIEILDSSEHAISIDTKRGKFIGYGMIKSIEVNKENLDLSIDLPKMPLSIPYPTKKLVIM